MDEDISPLLDRWPRDPEHLVRRIRGLDGRPKLQVRLPLGIEQYELNGRPDGMRPHGEESFLDYMETKLKAHGERTDSDGGFTLSSEDCRKLHEEGVLYYYRYLLCYQIGEYDLVERDTARNMKLFRFVNRYAEDDEDRKSLEQYWPYILRMRAMATAFRNLGEGDDDAASQVLRDTLHELKTLTEVDTAVFKLELQRSVDIIEATLRSIEKARPISEREQLIKRLERAVKDENYERAARLRDIIARMEG